MRSYNKVNGKPLSTLTVDVAKDALYKAITITGVTPFELLCMAFVVDRKCLSVLDFEGASIEYLLSILSKTGIEVALDNNAFKLVAADNNVRVDLTVLLHF